MTDREAMKLALEAFEYIEHNYMSLPAPATKAITALRERLAQPEQEPVAWRYRGNLHEFDPSDWAEGPVTPLYAAPPQRKPLTDEEIERACVPLGAAVLSFTEIARAIEAAHGIKE